MDSIISGSRVPGRYVCDNVYECVCEGAITSAPADFSMAEVVDLIPRRNISLSALLSVLLAYFEIKL